MNNMQILCMDAAGETGEVIFRQAPRFPMTQCSQCGKELGPGNSGTSHCIDHASSLSDRYLRQEISWNEYVALSEKAQEVAGRAAIAATAATGEAS